MTPYRRKVLAFALAMEAELKNNDHKGGWENMRASELIRRANWEFWELMGELSDATKSRTTGGDFTDSEKARILSEAADIANFCMMLVDVCGALGVKSEHESEDA